MGHWLVWGAMGWEGSLGLWGAGCCGGYYRAPGRGDMWGAEGCYGVHVWGVGGTA